MIQTWKIKNIETDKLHKCNNFEELKSKCNAIVIEGITDDFKILYFEDEKLRETCDISVYFDVDINSDN